MSSATCPVPINQQPLQEYKQISNSWFFSWPKNKDFTLPRALLTSWLIILPINLLLCFNSYSLRTDLLKVCFTSAVVSLGLPIILLIRLLASWDYICRRLTAQKVEYEETGWHDGSTWEKPEIWLQKDLLIAKYEVIPIIKNIINPLIICILLMLMGIFLCQQITR